MGHQIVVKPKVWFLYLLSLALGQAHPNPSSTQWNNMSTPNTLLPMMPTQNALLAIKHTRPSVYPSLSFYIHVHVIRFS